MGVTETIRRALQRGYETVESRLPSGLRSLLDRLADAGALADLDRLAPYLRHWQRYARLQRALLDYRSVSALLLAVRLGLLDELDRRPQTSREVADNLEMVPASAETLLAMLETEGIVERSEDIYELTGFARQFLVGNTETSDAPLLSLLTDYAAGFGDVMAATRAGETPAQFDIQLDQPSTDRFLEAVNSYLDRAGRELLAKAKLPSVEHAIVGSMGV